MKRIDTHQIYKQLIASGLDEASANAHLLSYTIISDSLFQEIKEWFKEAKEDFVSQKLVSITGSLILLALLAIGGQLWYLTHQVSSLDIRLTNLEKKFE